MSFTFRKAVRENVHIIVGLAGGTASGKTMSALRIARGMVGPHGKIALIDTENGRSLHYAGKPGSPGITPQGGEEIDFWQIDFPAPYSPAHYAEAFDVAIENGADCIVVDSASHEHEGEGGLLDMHEAEVERMSRGNPAKIDKINRLAWAKPKLDNRRLLSRIVNCKQPIILCFRADEKLDQKRDPKTGKTTIVKRESPISFDGIEPICEKHWPYEATCLHVLLADRPGFPHPVKCYNEHRPFFPLDQPLSEESGKQLAEWASGGKEQGTNDPAPAQPAPTVEWRGQLTAINEAKRKSGPIWQVLGSSSDEDGPSLVALTEDAALVERLHMHEDTGEPMVVTLRREKDRQWIVDAWPESDDERPF